MIFTPAFSLDTNHLNNLGPDRAVVFFRQLLWAEASRVGIGRNLIQVPGCINVGDGGIDAYIENADPLFNDIIPVGTTGFQIKSSDLSPGMCKKELHEQNNLDAPLKPEIKKILDEGGNYVLVLFADLTSPKRQRRKQAVQEELSNYGYNNRTRVYTIDQLIGFTERFISLVTWLKPDLSKGLSYYSWGRRRDINYPKTFISDEIREQWIIETRKQLRNLDGNCPVFRIIGLSGIGKTRLVYEVLADDDLKNRVIYIPSADQFKDSDLYNTIQTNETISAILVIDECDSQLHEDFVRSFSSNGERLALFTISHDFASVPPPTKQFKLLPLRNEEIKKLIQAESTGLPYSLVRRLTDFADGYPRIATLLADSYIINAIDSDEFIRITDEALMDRLIGGNELGQEQALIVKRVLSGLSLFQKIGYRGVVKEESRWLFNFLKVDWLKFKEVIHYEQQRGIIKGDYYLYVAPFILRIYLLNYWWEMHGFSKENFDEFIDGIPEKIRADLMESFFDHIPYITSSESGRKFTKTMLGVGGLFIDGKILRNKLGAKLFMKLSEADPESALQCLKRIIGGWNKDQLLDFTIGRREVIWSLKRIAMWRDLFPGAARLLLSLGEAENETWSDNASGVFVDLFSPGPGDVAPTEATPAERFIILEEAINSDSKEKRKIALRACDLALETQHFSRMIGGESQGLRRTPNLWQPETYKEIYDSYRRVWRLISEKIEDLPEDEQNQAINIILGRSRGLGGNPHLVGIVIDTLKNFKDRKIVEESTVLTEVLKILHFDSKRMLPDVVEQWQSFRDELSNNDFSSLMSRYVKMNFILDKIDKEENWKKRVKALAKQAFEENCLLTSELQWLVTTAANNGYQFGYELGELDRDLHLLPTLLEAQLKAGEDSSLLFLGGYFKALNQKDMKLWEKKIEEFASSKETANWLPELSWRSGINDKLAVEILRLAQSGLVTSSQFRIFEYGREIRKISQEIFQDWINFLLSTSEKNNVSIALGLYASYYLLDGPEHYLPEDLTLQLLSNPAFFEESEEFKPQPMDDYHWTEISKQMLKLYPERALEICDVILENFGNQGTIFDGSHSSVEEILNRIAHDSPEQMWWRISEYLGPPIDNRAYHLKEWLNGNSGFGMETPGALFYFPLEEVFKWVDNDIENRAWYLASFVPKKLIKEKARPCYPREVLIKYGHREDVRNNLMANLSSEGWSGPASLHYQTKKENLLRFIEGETEQVVVRWVHEYVASIDRSIQREKIREEREGH